MFANLLVLSDCHLISPRLSSRIVLILLLLSIPLVLLGFIKRFKVSIFQVGTDRLPKKDMQVIEMIPTLILFLLYQNMNPVYDIPA